MKSHLGLMIFIIFSSLYSRIQNSFKLGSVASFSSSFFFFLIIWGLFIVDFFLFVGGLKRLLNSLNV